MEYAIFILIHHYIIFSHSITLIVSIFFSIIPLQAAFGMKNLYFFASHIYQFSYTVPIYKKGGWKYDELLNNCFYFNDGKSIDRAVEFIKSIS